MDSGLIQERTGVSMARTIHPRNLGRWYYNGKDCCYTKSIETVLNKMLQVSDPKLQEFYQFQQHHVCKSVVTMMNRGVRIDKQLKEEMNNTFSELMEGCLEKLRWIVNEPEFNPNSTPQVKNLFKTLLGIKPLVNRKTKAESFGADAMLVYLEEYPEYRTLLTLFLEYKSIKVFVRTFLSMKLSYDERLRCSYNPAGTKTYRFSSRKDVDGNGGNLANLPSKGKIDLRYALQEIYTGEETDDSYSDIVPDGVDINTPYEGKLVLPNCKKMFIPDEGWVFFDADYSAIDLHFVVWESDCKFLKDIIQAGKDVYSILASHYYQKEIDKSMGERQVFKAVCHGCLTDAHEVLTSVGWVAIDRVSKEEPIAIWDSDTNAISFETPSNMLVKVETEDLLDFTGKYLEQTVTLNHRMPLRSTKTQKISIREAQYISKNHSVPLVGNYLGGEVKLDKNMVRFIVALQADGNIQHKSKDGTGSILFGFTKQRKIDRFECILSGLSLQYSKNIYGANKVTTFYIPTGQVNYTLKTLDWSILQWDREAIDTFLEELPFWDGNIDKTGRIRIFSTKRLDAEIWKTLYHLSGTLCDISTTTNSNGCIYYTVGKNTRCRNYNMKSGSIARVRHEGTKVYCPTVSTGLFLVRKNGKISITGNSNYLGKAPTLAAKAGLSVPQVKKVQDWYFKECPEIREWHNRIDNDVRAKQYTSNIFGARFWCLDLTDPMYLNKIVAAVPQSSAGILVNKALCNLEETEKGQIQILLQVHDSMAGIFKKEDITAVTRIKQYMEMPIPYADPLVIPVNIKTSEVSYGDCG